MQQPVEGNIKLDSGSLIKQNPKTASLMGALGAGRQAAASQMEGIQTPASARLLGADVLERDRQ